MGLGSPRAAACVWTLLDCTRVMGKGKRNGGGRLNQRTKVAAGSTSTEKKKNVVLVHGVRQSA